MKVYVEMEPTRDVVNLYVYDGLTHYELRPSETESGLMDIRVHHVQEFEPALPFARLSAQFWREFCLAMREVIEPGVER